MLAALLTATAFAAQPAPVLECGTTTLYGKTLTIRVTGPDLTCERARTIVDRARCRAGKRWSCFSFRPPGAVLVSEYLALRFGRDGVLDKVEMVQG